MAIRQKIRLAILFLILLTFPITFNYFSVYLIIQGSAEGVMTFSFFFWALWLVTALLIGRAGCGYICPLGALQEAKDRMVPKELVKVKYLKLVKYILTVGWSSSIIFFAVAAGGYRSINLLYFTESGVSIDEPMKWVTYGTIVVVVLLPVFFMGKRGFCHYFCPWGVLNMLGSKIKGFFHWPSLRLKVSKDKCVQCQTCDANCPMSLIVSEMVRSGSIENIECILCGTCVDNCANSVISYSWKRPR